MTKEKIDIDVHLRCSVCGNQDFKVEYDQSQNCLILHETQCRKCGATIGHGTSIEVTEIIKKYPVKVDKKRKEHSKMFAGRGRI